MIQLPHGWVSAELAEIRLDKLGVVDPLRTPDQLFELYSVPAFPSGKPEIVAGKAIGSSKQTVSPGTVLVCKINPRINRAWVVGDFSDHPKLASTEWIAFPPIEGVEARYLSYFFRQDRFRDFLAANVSGVGGSLMRVRRNALDTFPIVIPPIPEQARISAKLDELLSDLDAGITTLQRAQANLKRYRAAVLKAAVEGRLTEKWRAAHPDVEPAEKLLERTLAERRKRWEEAQLKKFAEKKQTAPTGWKAKYPEPMKVGPAPKLVRPKGWSWATLDQIGVAERPIAYGVLQPGRDVDGGVPLVRVGDVNEGRIAVESLKRIDSEIAARFPRTKLFGGEVLLTIVGTIGRTAVVPIALAGGNTARAVAVIPVQRLLDPRFVEICLRDRRMQSQLTQAAHEVARKTLNLEDVRVARIPLPPLEEQAQIVDEVERLLSRSDLSEREVDRSFVRVTRLRQSILKQAFEGKLVPQDPKDEPASELLARIRAGRQAGKGLIGLGNGVGKTRKEIRTK